MLFTNGILQLDSVADRRAVAVLEAAINRASGKIRPSDLLGAAVAQGESSVMLAISQGLAGGGGRGIARPDQALGSSVQPALRRVRRESAPNQGIYRGRMEHTPECRCARS